MLRTRLAIPSGACVSLALFTFFTSPEQMKCEFPQHENVCKRCKAGGHPCIVEGRKPRSAPKLVPYSYFLLFPFSLSFPPARKFTFLLLTLSFTPSPRFPDIARFPLFLLYKLLLTRHSSSSRSPHSLHYLEPTHTNTNDCPRKHHITYEHPPTSSHLDPSSDVHLFAFRSCGDLDLPVVSLNLFRPHLTNGCAP